MSDSWGEPATARSSSNTILKKKVAPISDNWDNDDDLNSTEDSQKIWEDANNKAPMPQIVANSSSSSASSAPLAAAAAALSQPTMRILKRPSASSSQASSPPPTQSATPPLAERQARYEAARQRIFADASSSPTSPASLSSSSSPAPSPAPSTAVRITREPHGPTAVATAGSASPNAKGFGHRRAPKPPKAAASP